MLNKRNNKISSILMVCEKMKMLYFQHESASRGFITVLFWIGLKQMKKAGGGQLSFITVLFWIELKLIIEKFKSANDFYNCVF